MRTIMYSLAEYSRASWIEVNNNKGRECQQSSTVLNHLGLVASVIKDVGLIAEIDKRIPVSKEKGAKLTIGQRVAAMILNGLDSKSMQLRHKRDVAVTVLRRSVRYDYIYLGRMFNLEKRIFNT